MNHIAGEIEITTISLYAKQGVLNLTEHVQSMRINESIATPGVSAELTVWDTMSLLSNLPILGGERIYIEFNTPGRKVAKFDLKIAAIKEAEPSDNMRTKGYIMYACTPEVLTNKAHLISKAYNTNISNIVEDVIKNYLSTKKKINVQQTKGIQKIILPNLKPFDAVKMLRKRSVSVNDKSSSYVFFENQEGFHFRTIEDLMKGSVGDRKFINNPTQNIDVKTPLFRSILAHDMPQQFDVVKRLDKGGLATEVQKFDYKTLEFTKTVTTFDASQFKSADGTMKDPANENLNQNYGKTAGHQTWVNHDSGNPDTFISEMAGSHSSGLGVYGQGLLGLQVFGDSELTAGQVIQVDLIENSTSTEAPKLHGQNSGNYLIGNISHEIGPSGDNPRYTCNIECIKGGYKS